MDLFLFSKVLVQLIYPLSLVIWLLVLSFLLLLFRRKVGAGIFLFVALVIIFFGSSPIALEFYRQHEMKYLSVPIDEAPTVDAIVVLAGYGSTRALHAMRLYRAGKAPLVIVSGGSPFPQKGTSSESEHNADLLTEWGIPWADIVIENTSRNTRENALETKKLLPQDKQNRVLLVTGALHMLRAAATFEAVGIYVVPSSPDSLKMPTPPKVLDWIPSLNRFGLLNKLIHEKLGILVYRSRGWID